MRGGHHQQVHPEPLGLEGAAEALYLGVEEAERVEHHEDDGALPLTQRHHLRLEVVVGQA